MPEPIDWEQFESLSLEEQRELFRQKPFKEKGELLLHSRDPLSLTRSMSQEELYLMTKGMDIEERSEIIRFANLPQLFFLTDIDCWKGDRLDPRGFIRWLETLRNADSETLMNWFLGIDYEAIVTGLKKIIRVVKPEREYPIDEILGDVPYFTLDDFYYVAVSEEDLETVKRALEVLYENHRGRYVAFLEGVIAELDDQLEEEAYRLREIRLAERGFPEPESAHRIYRVITQKEMEEYPPKNWVKKNTAGSPLPETRLPNYPVLWSKDRFFLDEVFARLGHEKAEVVEGLQEEMAWLSNKVLAAQGIDFSSEEKVRQGIERARYFVSLGLELLSGRDLTKALAMIQGKWLENIFRWAVTKMTGVRDEAVDVIHRYWEGEKTDFLEFLMPPYQFIFDGLLRPVPAYYDAEVPGLEAALRDFKCERELERTKLSVRQIAFLFEKLDRKYPGLFKKLDAGNKTREMKVSLFSLLGGIFAAAVLGKKTKNFFLAEKELRDFLESAFEAAGEQRVLKAPVKADFLDSFCEKAEREALQSLWGLVFADIEDDFGRLDPAKKINLRYISAVPVLLGAQPKKPSRAKKPEKVRGAQRT